jgi:hypothetical protein
VRGLAASACGHEQVADAFPNHRGSVKAVIPPPPHEQQEAVDEEILAHTGRLGREHSFRDSRLSIETDRMILTAEMDPTPLHPSMNAVDLGRALRLIRSGGHR